jgi:hypothetical protein
MTAQLWPPEDVLTSSSHEPMGLLLSSLPTRKSALRTCSLAPGAVVPTPRLPPPYEMLVPEVVHRVSIGAAAHVATPDAFDERYLPAAAPLPVSWSPVKRPVPVTSSAVPGALVPIPTLPLLKEMFAPVVLHCVPKGGTTQDATPLALELSSRPAAAPLPVSWKPVKRPVPVTSSVAPGAALPMPTLPLL